MPVKAPNAMKGLSFYLIIFAVLIALTLSSPLFSQQEPIQLTQVLDQIEKDNVTEVTVSGYTLVVTLKQPVKELRNLKEIKVALSPLWMEKVWDLLKNARDTGKIAQFTYEEPQDYSILFNLVPVVLMIGMMVFVWMMFMRQSNDGKNAMSFGRSRHRMNDPSKNKITFRDVAGADEEKDELKEVVDFLKNPRKYAELGARIPKGILLVGAPGTGKTLLAKAVAGEAGVPFFSISGSDFVEMFVGVGASRVRDLFESAKKNSPSIVFIDEIDAVGRHRGAGLGGGHDEREQTLNQLLVEMDGFGPNEGVIIMAATNRPDILDPALLRPGRFDRRITVSRPDIKGREEILKVHARNKPLATAVDLREVARMTPGFTGADLENLLNEAALLAARRGSKEIIYGDISEAVFKVMIGPEKRSRIISEKEKRLTAYHEAGHAIVLRVASTTDRVERVSIIPAGLAGGYTAHKPEEDQYYSTRSQLMENIMISLGGRAAEDLVLGEVSTGAASDLQTCNGIARDMITRYGMSDRLGNLVFGSGDDEVFLGRDYGHIRNYSDKLASIIDEEVKRIIDEAYAKVKDILGQRLDILHRLAETLLVKEKIEGPEFEAIFNGQVLPPEPPPAISAEPGADPQAIAPTDAAADAAVDAAADAPPIDPPAGDPPAGEPDSPAGVRPPGEGTPPTSEGP